jgi:3D (Asp-Asp-Asp) domain-containing protein
VKARPAISAGLGNRIPARHSDLARYGARMIFQKITRALALIGCFLLVGCASGGGLPKYERPIARKAVQHVRTTAYTHSEADHRRYGRRTALGTQLQSGRITSAAADWSRWPVGTMFRIRETGQLYVVDDYGRALSGTNTIDLYKTSRSAMNRWGVRRVTIENIRWGDVDRSLAILRQRTKYKHVRRMIDQIEDRYSSLRRPGPTIYASAPSTAPASRGVALRPFSVGYAR